MNRKRLIANPWYGIALTFVIETWGLVCVIITVLAHSILGIVIYPIFLFGLIGCIVCIQTVTLTKEGFVIKCCGFQIVQANWNQIVKIEVLDLDSLVSRGSTVAKLKWIVLYTEEGQKVKGGGPSWKKAPWLIIATKKNQNAIREFAPKDIISF